MAGAMNRANYNMRTAFTPQYQQVRQYVPQTMTCTVPYCKKVAVPGMKQVTYNVQSMQPTQTVRKVAVNKVTYQTAEVTVMQPVQVTKTMQVGTRVSYHPAGTTAIGSAPTTTNGPGTALNPTADPNNSKAVAPRTANPNGGLDSNEFNNKRSSSLDPNRGSLDTNDTFSQRVSDVAEPVKATSAPTVVRVSLWVARTPSPHSPSNPQPSGKSAAISIADSAR
jgi:hypothetical protein